MNNQASALNHINKLREKLRRSNQEQERLRRECAKAIMERNEARDEAEGFRDLAHHWEERGTPKEKLPWEKQN